MQSRLSLRYDRCRIRSYAYIGFEGDSSVVGRPLTLAASLADP
jgi:hypothetical protein